MGKKILKALGWVAAIAFLAYSVIFGWGPAKDGSMKTIKLGLDLAGGVSITYQAVGDDITAQKLKDATYILQQRAENYTPDAEVYQEGSDRITIEIPGVTDANKVLTEMGKPGELYFIAQKGSDGEDNYSMSLGLGADGTTLEYVYELNRTLEEIIADGCIVLTGSEVKNANPGSQQTQTGGRDFVVELTLNEEGIQKFSDATALANEKGYSIAIYYDNKIISAPRVSAHITDGSAIINGMGDYEYAENLASMIRIGALPIKLEEVRSQVVGAKLGQDAIQTSLLAGAIGLAIIILFMIIVYRVPGVVAGIALCIYTMLDLIIINLAQLTFTLPGIAGIILSIGMAVDANVIIFERIKEELATGKTVNSAMKIGFNKAFSAIFDGNITTLIAAFVLAVKGSGSVKGFAYTLAIGIVLSMFTALVVTRFLLKLFYDFGCKSEKCFGVAKDVKSVNFISKKNIFFSISGLLIVVGIVFMIVNASRNAGMFNYGLDFKGGTSTTVTFDKDYSQEEIEATIIPDIVEAIGDSTVLQQKVQASNDVVFKTNNLSVEQREAMEKVFVEKYGVEQTSIITENISAVVSSEMKQDAIIAVIIATICMLLYIWLRFKDIRFAASAVIALLHDVLIVLAFYAVARIALGNTFIACMLTILGYSINATIVIFDRIRENLSTGDNRRTLEEIVNLSICQTMRRSVYTTLTTFIMVVILFVLGVTSIREFAAPLMVGIICGGYSSVCITGALLYVFKKGKKNN